VSAPRESDEVAERLNGNDRLDAARAHLLEMAGDSAGAIDQYRAAAQKTTNVAERRYLTKQAARLQSR
jgi:predicted RNA polymerase sigma factor